MIYTSRQLPLWCPEKCSLEKFPRKSCSRKNTLAKNFPRYMFSLVYFLEPFVTYAHFLVYSVDCLFSKLLWVSVIFYNTFCVSLLVKSWNYDANKNQMWGKSFLKNLLNLTHLWKRRCLAISNSFVNRLATFCKSYSCVWFLRKENDEVRN